MNGYNFTERVRVLQMAQEEAQRLHHEYVGTEHILLGLIREGEGGCRRAAEPLRRSRGGSTEDRGARLRRAWRRPLARTCPTRREPRRCSSWR
ncbi:MAG: Clp protease N-terminal domain-containing protein [Gemmatimonadaceae bacterium]